MAEYIIYALADPASGEVRYVGATRRHPRHRVTSHRIGGGRCSADLSAWIRSLDTTGCPVKLVILERSPENWIEAEQRWIAHYRSIGADLFNRAAGGLGSSGIVWSEQSRQKLRAAKLGRPRPDLAERNRQTVKLTAEQVEMIRALDGKRGEGARVARELGVSVALVSLIRHNKRRS